MTQFSEFFHSRLETGGFTTEDTLASVLPLMREVLDAHAAGTVAPLEGLDDLHVAGVRIWFEDARRRPLRSNASAIRRIKRPETRAVEVVIEAKRTIDVADGGEEIEDLAIGRRDGEFTSPVFLPGYVSWEHLVEHHDPLTDVFSLGMILASLACGLDFNEPHDLKSFVLHRRNLFALNSGVHPVLARAIFRMTELKRHKRSQDLASLVRTLENYRDQDIDFEFEMARVPDFEQQDKRTKQEVVLHKLRERLFEISRRNRLLHFRPTMQTVNLTHASVPLSFDVQSIRPQQILVWNDALRQEILRGKPISLNRFLNFSEALYLPSVLDRIMAEARRDQAEFGFAQLRLAVCFLHWANLKEKPIERFESPLVLIPVQLKKKKGIRDTYLLSPLSGDAEINPVVRHQFKELYDIDLPETIDLSETTLDQFFDYLVARCQASEPAVSINKVDRPRIALIHDKARRRLDQYRRRARLAGRGVRSFQDLDYSYDPANYHPLGITLFLSRIRPSPTHLREVIEEKPRPRSLAAPDPDPPQVEKEKTFFSLEQGSEENPYTWKYDLCSVTLANFKYRKMSLVRDYESLLDEQPPNPAFESVFSLVPRPVDHDPPQPPPLDDRYDVVPCDPTQAAAIEEARIGKSYIIQGPPGTGKSQTITNLIADYVARGKRVLFVCEKRAALDVVYARLRQCGSGPLCCLIHDSQTDKREFVMDLKQTYEHALSETGQPASEEGRRRRELLKRLEREMRPLVHFDISMREAPAQAGVPLRKLLRRCLELHQRLPQLSALQKERLPDYATWWRHREKISAFGSTVKEIQRDGILANHPLRLLSPRLNEIDHPLALVRSTTDEADKQFVRLDHTLRNSGIPKQQWQSLAQIRQLAEYARRVDPVVRGGNLSLLDPESPRARDFEAQVRQLRRQQETLAEARERTQAWRHKLPPAEVAVAIEQAQMYQGRFFAWLQPGWWRLRRILNGAYDFKTHVVRPSWTQVLQALDEEYAQSAALNKKREAIADAFHIENNVDDIVDRVAAFQADLPQLPDDLARIHAALLKSSKADRIVERLVQAADAMDELSRQLVLIMDNLEEQQLEDLREDLRQAVDNLEDLADYLHCTAEIDAVPEALSDALRSLPLDVPSVEAAVANGSLEDVYREKRSLQRFNAVKRRQHVRRLEHLYEDWLASNAAEIRSRVQQRFLESVHVSGLPASQLTEEQKPFKKRYNRGRRELEHEFGKTMRYRPIRDLVSGDSGEVVKELKPVWLMSPLSVSDTLPLDTEHVDVVIFDEASQITLEEAIPSVFRACQSIVVGDEMQLPPTDFFSAKRTEDEEELLIEEGGELVAYDLDSNSFLNHSARNLPSTMLGWHYRSRSESLISFSNWMFYNGRLLTVPEETLPTSGRPPLDVTQLEDALQGADALRERAVSFHFITNGVYDRRRNRREAEYIAALVNALFDDETELSIGIVAFSEAQQDEIESALERRAQQDSAFRDRLEAEREREVDGQFVGLLVKNLENIQGDERDVIILSICYGHNPQGRMLMNFGPINRSGGEKRLNVAFSRAKCQMAVVSSIRYGEITNDYNDGANCLKNYLRYAEAVSAGETAAAHRVLRGMSHWQEGAEEFRDADRDPLAEQLATELTDRGWMVDRAIGQSHFRCDLAVRRQEDSAYRLGILLDNEAYYEQTDLLERDMMRPRLLRAFGWKVAVVLAKDWHEDREAVLTRLTQLLAGQDTEDQDVASNEGIDEVDDAMGEPLDDEIRDDDGPIRLEFADEAPQDADLSEIDPKSDPESDTEPDAEPDSIATTAAKRFEFVGGGSSKFWEITLDGNQHTVRFGRIGTDGQTRVKVFEDGDQAQRDADRLIRGKLAKGYREC